jgi:hypothetical protein
LLYVSLGPREGFQGRRISAKVSGRKRRLRMKVVPDMRSASQSHQRREILENWVIQAPGAGKESGPVKTGSISYFETGEGDVVPKNEPVATNGHARLLPQAQKYPQYSPRKSRG